MSKRKNNPAAKKPEHTVELPASPEPAITFGTEVERYEVKLSEEKQQKYRKQLNKAIKAQAIQRLRLHQIFPEEAEEKASLCIMKKEGIPFMEVLFDDNVKMTQLEFISIPYQDLETGQYTGGVKKLEEFFTLENIQDISEAMKAFSVAFENISTGRGRAAKQKFTFEFPEHAQKLFKGVKLEDTKQGLAVHITHSLPISNDHDYLEKLNEFFVERRKDQMAPFGADFLLKHGKKEGVQEEVSPNALLDQIFPPHLSHNWEGTKGRNENQPLFKMPRDYLYGDSYPKNVYIQRVIDGEVLAPTSNLVEHTMHEIEIYSELLEAIQFKIKEEKANKESSDIELDDPIALLTSSKKAAALKQLESSKIKLEQTIKGLKEQVVESVKEAKPSIIRYLGKLEQDYAELAKLNNPQNNPLAGISIFDSFEEKFQGVGLCEHRGGQPRVFFSTLLQYWQGKSDSGVIKLEPHTIDKCHVIIEHFKLLKDAHSILAKKEQEGLELQSVFAEEKKSTHGKSEETHHQQLMHQELKKLKQDQVEGKGKRKEMEPNTIWFGPEHIISALEGELRELGSGWIDIGMVQTHQAMNEDSLNKCIREVKVSHKKYHFVMINVHEYTKEVPAGNTGNDSKHWVGAYINRKGVDQYEIKYVDPMGEAVSRQVKSLLSQNLYDTAVQDITLNYPYQVGSWEAIKGPHETIHAFKGNENDCAPLLTKLFVDVALGREINDLKTVEASKRLGQQLRQDYSQYANSHLKRAGKGVGEGYDIKEIFAAINLNNAGLLDKLSKQAVITADIELKAVDVKEQVASDKVGKVEFLAEGNHIQDHAGNTQSLIDRIETGDIGKDTVIAIERKSYGQNLGVPDVIMLANIIEYNVNNHDKQLQIPEEITENSLIYQDAVLYNTAKKHGVKVVGLEGRNLKAGKDSPEYDEAREEYMASRITQLTSKGYNVVAYVGSAHVDNLKQTLESKLENKPSVAANTPNKVSEELQKMAGSIGEQARGHVSQSFTTTASSIPVLPNEKQPIKQNNGIGSR